MPITNPTDISGLIGWWTAKPNMGIAVLTNITGWTSQEGNSFVMNSPGPGARPSLESDSGVYERKVVVLDGIDEKLEHLSTDTPSISIAASVPMYYFIVFRAPTSNTGSNPEIINLHSVVADRINLEAHLSAPLDGIRAHWDVGGSVQITEGIHYDDGDWMVITVFSIDGTSNLQMRLNNSDIGQNTIDVGAAVDQVVLGDPPGGTDFCNTRYAEIIIYGGEGVNLTAQNFADLQDYFEHEWFSQPGIGFGMGAGIIGEG